MWAFGSSPRTRRVRLLVGVAMKAEGWSPGVLRSGLSGEHPFSYVESPDGVVLMVNGIDPALRWDWFSRVADEAGCPAPDQIMTMREASWNNTNTPNKYLHVILDAKWHPFFGSARPWFDPQLVGQFVFRYREEPEDKSSIVGYAFTVPWSGGLELYHVYNLYRSRVNDPVDFLNRLNALLATKQAGRHFVIEIKPLPVIEYARLITGGGGGGSSTVVELTPVSGSAESMNGEYIAFQQWVDRYGNVSNPGPFARANLRGVTRLLYENVQTPTDPKIVARRVWRTTAGQINQFYLDFETTDLKSTVFTSTKTDKQLELSETMALYGDNLEALGWGYGVPSSFRRSLARNDGVYYASGVVPYTTGAAVVTSGSDVVTGLRTAWKKSFEGRFFYTDDDRAGNEIIEVDENAQTLKLARRYSGLTGAYRSYLIAPGFGETNQLVFSSLESIEGWPYHYSVSVDGQDDRVTGVAALRGFLYVLRERHIVKMLGNIPGEGSFRAVSMRGCLHSRVALEFDGNAYFMDRAGVFMLDGRDGTVELSQPIDDLFTGENRELAINWQGQHLFHASRDNKSLLRWFVSLGSERWPRHALVLQWPTGKWFIEEYPWPLTSSTYWHGEGGDVSLALGRKVWALTKGGLDVSDSAPILAAVQSAGYDWIQSASPLFGVKAGMTVAICAGRGAWQWNQIVEVSGTTMRVLWPWAVVPDGTGRQQSYFQIGGVPWQWRGPMYTFLEGETAQRRDIGVFWEPAPGRMALRRYRHGSEKPTQMGVDYVVEPVTVLKGEREVLVDTAYRHGALVVSRDDWQERDQRVDNTMQPEFVGVTGKNGIRIYRMRYEGVPPKRPMEGDDGS